MYVYGYGEGYVCKCYIGLFITLIISDGQPIAKPSASATTILFGTGDMSGVGGMFWCDSLPYGDDFSIHFVTRILVDPVSRYMQFDKV